MSCVRIGHEDGIGQVLRHPIGIADGDHFVANAVYDKRGLRDGLEICESFACERLPITEGGDLPRRASPTS